MMNEPSRGVSWSLWIGVGLTITLVGLAFVLARLRSRTSPLPVYSQLENFRLTNQWAQPVTLDDLKGQVWLVDVIFTRCPGPCARMSRQMAEIQAALGNTKGVKLVSLTTDPDYDQPEVMKKYAERFGAASNRWQFLTGTKPELARLAVGGLKFVAQESKPEERDNPMDLFIHSTTFALVDKQRRLRAVFETQSTVPDESEANAAEGWARTKARILAAIQNLTQEP
jgi:protein SCO1/2